MQPEQQSILATRIDALERAARRQRRFFGVAALAVLVLPLLAFKGGRASVAVEEVKAERFILVDAEGKVRGRFATTGQGYPELVLSDLKGRDRASIKLSDEDASIAIRDSKGLVRSALSVDAMDFPHLLLNGQKGEPRLHAAVNDKGHPNLLLRGDDGDIAAGFGLLQDGSAWVKPALAPPAESGKR